MGYVQRQIIHGVMAVVDHPKTTLAIAAVFLVASVLFAWCDLRISTDQNKLFDQHVWFFRQYMQFIHEFPENEAVYVVLQPTNPAHPPAARQWVAVARKLTVALQGLKQDVQSVDSHVPLRQLGNQALLFASRKTVVQEAAQASSFAQMLQLLAQRSGGLTHALGRSRLERFLRLSMLQPPQPGEAGFLSLLLGSLNHALATPVRQWRKGRQIPDLSTAGGPVTPATYGYYYIRDQENPSRHLLLIKVFQRRTYNSLSAVTRPLRHIRAAIHKVIAHDSLFKVGVTGRPALDADEMHTTNHDTHWAETVAMLVVFLGLVVVLRSVWLALVAELTLGVAIGWTFGYATLAVGELNLLSTVFVIALIGIGMDYLIQILVRYRREAKRYVRPRAVWARVFRFASPPILTACLGAAGAFFVAIFTHFAGAGELGIIAGGGLLLCLLAGYTVLPALLVLWPARVPMVEAADRYGDLQKTPRAGWWKFLTPGCWLIGLALMVPFIGRTGFSANLLKLQAKGLKSVRLVPKLPTWYAVQLSKNLSHLAAVRQTLERAAKQPGSTILRTSSLLDAQANQRYLAAHTRAIAAIRWQAPAPATPKALPALAAAVGQLSRAWHLRASGQAPSGQKLSTARRQLAATARLLQLRLREKQATAVRRFNAWQQALEKQLHAAAAMLTPPPLDIPRLPAVLRDHYVSRDGHFALYIYPRLNLWKQHNLAAFVRQLQGTARRPGLVPAKADLTGIAIQLYHSTNAIRRAFISSTLYAIVLVVLLVLIDLRRLGLTLMAVSVLALGLPMLAGVMGLLHIQWNFANFFGLPILIGAGHEYGVFMVHRYKEVLHDPRRAWRFWDASDRALFLCAFVTSSSFGFLAFAQHRGIASLGLVMALGCACIYLAAILVLRPLLQWRLHDKKVYSLL